MRFKLTGVLSIVVLVLPSIAQAAGLGCHEGHFFPRRTEAPRHMPANAAGILYWPSEVLLGPDAGVSGSPMRMERVGLDGVSQEVAFEVAGEQPPYLVTPEGGFEVGATYRLWAETCQGELAKNFPTYSEAAVAALNRDWDPELVPLSSTEVLVLEPTAMPTALPVLQLSDSQPLTIYYEQGGSESPPARLAQTIHLSLSKSVGPWEDALAFATMVDGKPYRPSAHMKLKRHHGESWIGRGKDLLATLCERPDEAQGLWESYEREMFLTPGRHEVRLVATIPGTDIQIDSPSQEFSLGSCPTKDGHEGSLEPPANTSPPSEETEEPRPLGVVDSGVGDVVVQPAASPARSKDGTSDKLASAQEGEERSRESDKQPPSAREEPARVVDAGVSDASDQGGASRARAVDAELDGGCSVGRRPRTDIIGYAWGLAGLGLVVFRRRRRRVGGRAQAD